MKLYNAVLTKSGIVNCGPGIPIEVLPYPHFEVGTLKRASVWVAVGQKFMRLLSVMREHLCDNDGQPIGAKPCEICKGPAVLGPNNEHPFVKKLAIHNPFEGSIFVTQKKTLVLVEESTEEVRGQKIGIHFVAEPGLRGRAIIVPAKQNTVLARGESLIEFNRKGSFSYNGYSSEALLVVAPGDVFEVRRSGDLEGAPSHVTVKVGHDFSLRVQGAERAERIFRLEDGFDKDEVAEAEEKMTSTVIREAPQSVMVTEKEPSPKQIEKALKGPEEQLAKDPSPAEVEAALSRDIRKFQQ